MADPIWSHAAADPEKVALRNPHTSWTYAQLRDKAAACAAALAEAGVGVGDRIVLIAPSVLEFAAV